MLLAQNTRQVTQLHFCSHVVAKQQCHDALSYSFPATGLWLVPLYVGPQYMDSKQMDWDSAPKQDLIFRLINDDTEIII